MYWCGSYLRAAVKIFHGTSSPVVVYTALVDAMISFKMKTFLTQAIDFSKVETLVYHLPDGPSFSVEMNGLGELLDIELEIGDICDTSEIDGVLHFFPRGNA